MILHTVNKSPLQHGALGSCLQFIGNDDALVLLEDGVYAAITGVDCGLERLSCKVYAVAADVEARGLGPRLYDGVTVISYEAFVDLCTGFNSVKNWS